VLADAVFEDSVGDCEAYEAYGPVGATITKSLLEVKEVETKVSYAAAFWRLLTYVRSGRKVVVWTDVPDI
jgi:hypothetical protein